MADHAKAVKHFTLALAAAKKGDTKTARHHGGHAFSALNDRVGGPPKAPSMALTQPPKAPMPAQPPAIMGGEPNDADPMDSAPVPVQTGGGLMARLRAFGKK